MNETALAHLQLRFCCNVAGEGFSQRRVFWFSYLVHLSCNKALLHVIDQLTAHKAVTVHHTPICWKFKCFSLMMSLFTLINN